MVYGKVGFFEDGGQFKLIGGHLVVARFAGDAQFEGLYLEVFHEGLHAFGDGSEVVVVHLLVFGRIVPHERPTGQHQVGTSEVETFVNQEVFLFPTQIAGDFFHLRVEISCYGGCGGVHSLQRPEERGFIVERFARVGNEDGGDAKCVVDDEDGRCGVPGGVTACLEGVADAAVGK